MLRISSLPLSVSFTPLPHPGPAAPLLSSSANMSLPRSPHPLCALYNSLSVSLKMFESHYHSFPSLHLTFFKLSRKLPHSRLCVHTCELIRSPSEVLICSASSHGFQLADVKKGTCERTKLSNANDLQVALVYIKSFLFIFHPTAVIQHLMGNHIVGFLFTGKGRRENVQMTRSTQEHTNQKQGSKNARTHTDTHTRKDPWVVE